jgi:hypothetical protein
MTEQSKRMVEEAKRVGHQSREERMGRKYQFQAEKMGQQLTHMDRSSKREGMLSSPP